MRKGPEPAQPEWPEAVSATGAVPVAEGGGEADGMTQRFPDTGAVTALRVEDPWDESGRAGPAGRAPGAAGGVPEPEELTVRLDRASAEPGGTERPVFVDESGRRSRRFRRFGLAVGLACGVYAVVIVVTLVSGNSNAPWLPVPGQADDRPTNKVDTSPAPTDPARPPGAGAGVVVPRLPGSPGLPGEAGASAPAAGRTRPTAGPGAGTAAPHASAGPVRPGTSGAPRPTGSGTAGPQRPGTGTTGPVVQPTPSQATTSPSPSPSGGGGSTTPDPSTPPGGGTGSGGAPGTGGSGTVADGPGTPVPVTAEPGPGPTGTPGPTTAPDPPTEPGPAGSSGGTSAPAPVPSGLLA